MVLDAVRDYVRPKMTLVEAVDGLVVKELSAWVPVTREVFDDEPFLRAAIADLLWTTQLASYGFLGSVRCARCRRRTRCVYTAEILDGRPYGRSCFAVAYWTRVGETM